MAPLCKGCGKKLRPTFEHDVFLNGNLDRESDRLENIERWSHADEKRVH